MQAPAVKYATPTIESVKEALLLLGDALNEAEAIGVFGSLARGIGFTEHSDIDIFVVLKQAEPGFTTDYLWHKRISDALARFGRDVTVLIYTVGDLKAILGWYTLRLAAEGIILFDKSDIQGIFNRIVRTAEQTGLVRRPIDDTWVWSAPPGFKFGQVINIQLDDAK